MAKRSKYAKGVRGYLLQKNNKQEPEPTPEEIAEYEARAKEVRDSWSELETQRRANGGRIPEYPAEIKQYVYDGRTMSFDYAGTR